MLLQRTYMRFIEEEATAKRARAQIRPGDWSMVKRVGREAQKKEGCPPPFVISNTCFPPLSW